MIGQDKLYKRLRNYRLKTFPVSNLFIGNVGCGKHLFMKEVCRRFNLPYVDITDNISKDTIDELYIKSTPTAYYIDLIKLTETTRHINKENAILKFVEEPPLNSIIFILAEYESQIIDTIKNRCVEWKFAPYTIKELKEVKELNNDILYHILNTPGKLINSKDEVYYMNLFALCDTIIKNIARANLSNTLSLEKHIVLTKDEVEDVDKYDLEIFLDTMKYRLGDISIHLLNELDLKAFIYTNKIIDKSHTLNINKRYLLDNYLIGLKEIYDKS